MEQTNSKHVIAKRVTEETGQLKAKRITCMVFACGYKLLIYRDGSAIECFTKFLRNDIYKQNYGS